MSITMRLFAACVAALLTIGRVASSLQVEPGSLPRAGLYDANPNHLWNRVHDDFHVRIAPDGTEYGFDVLFAGKSGGLRAVAANERDFVTFSANGMDPFERESSRGPFNLSRVLDGCINCHHVGFEPAIVTVLSLRRMLKPDSLIDSRHKRWALGSEPNLTGTPLPTTRIHMRQFS